MQSTSSGVGCSYPQLMIRQLSKRDLYEIFGCINQQGRHLQRRWSKFWTDEALDAVGLSREEFRTIKVFSYDQTTKIVEHFKIQPEELSL
jgi:hypothetical protein